MQRTNYSSGAEWEDIVGYSRAVRVGNLIEVSGTVASGEDGKFVGAGNPCEQARCIYQKIEEVLQQSGASMENVIRVRMFVTDIRQWKEYARAHSEYFKRIKPCNTMVEVNALIDPQFMVEIEATAMISSS